ncbi:hypothetical protein [Sphingobacterium sp.]|jgi:hypothetical protein|uniref:hypothetical protein n=1 Tax=Sphingobacterium sp. TaxID=341027 RepID=UPI00289BF9C2|nr:hypothetical protein [Sphingobacterium sp.]
MRSKIIYHALCSFILLILIKGVRAQDHLIGPTLSYQFQKGSIVKTGAYFAFPFIGDHILRADATANFTWTQKKFAVIPEAAITYYPQTYVLTPFVRTEVTPYTVTPKLGVSLATLLDLDFGYGFSINDKKNYRPMKGFAVSLRFSIPLNYRLNM